MTREVWTSSGKDAKFSLSSKPTWAELESRVQEEIQQLGEELRVLRSEKTRLYFILEQVLACFKSRAASSTCTEDHHPCCTVMVENVLSTIEKESTP